MSRLIFDPTPPDTKAPLRRVLDSIMGSVREILDGGFRWREQVGHVLDVQIDTDDLPINVSVPGLKAQPESVVLLRAMELDGDGAAISGGSVSWTWPGDESVTLTALGALASSTQYTIAVAVME